MNSGTFEKGQAAPAADAASRRGWRRWKLLAAVAIVIVGSIMAGAAAYTAYVLNSLLTPAIAYPVRAAEAKAESSVFSTSRTAGAAEYDLRSVSGRLAASRQVLFSPGKGFSSKERVNVLFLGVDDTPRYGGGKGNTDSIMVLSADLIRGGVSLLSIPRDCFVPINGTGRTSRINAAYALGGIETAKRTVEDLLGVDINHHLILDSRLVGKAVDDLGGIEVDVEHAMNYDDDRGGFHVHLRPGRQTLDWEKAVGFLRYRHANRGESYRRGDGSLKKHLIGGPSPEDGDKRRIYRQQQVARALFHRLRSPAALLKAGRVIDALERSGSTDLTRVQILDLVSLCARRGAGRAQMAQLPANTLHLPSGMVVLALNERAKPLYVDWLLRGSRPRPDRELTPIWVNNMTPKSFLTKSVMGRLQAAGFADVNDSRRSSEDPVAQSRVDAYGHGQAVAEDIARAAGIPVSRVAVHPVTAGVARCVSVVLGADLTGSVGTRTGRKLHPSPAR